VIRPPRPEQSRRPRSATIWTGRLFPSHTWMTRTHALRLLDIFRPRQAEAPPPALSPTQRLYARVTGPSDSPGSWVWHEVVPTGLGGFSKAESGRFGIAREANAAEARNLPMVVIAYKFPDADTWIFWAS
jgi:hypothetical protein